jgi:hypothetical protein
MTEHAESETIQTSMFELQHWSSLKPVGQHQRHPGQVDEQQHGKHDREHRGDLPKRFSSDPIPVFVRIARSPKTSCSSMDALWSRAAR